MKLLSKIEHLLFRLAGKLRAHNLIKNPLSKVNISAIQDQVRSEMDDLHPGNHDWEFQFSYHYDEKCVPRIKTARMDVGCSLFGKCDTRYMGVVETAEDESILRTLMDKHPVVGYALA